MKNSKDNKGFTLMELLIVVAIIVVLIAIMIPVISSKLDDARRAADAANVRAVYAQVLEVAATDPRETTDNVGYDNTSRTYYAGSDAMTTSPKEGTKVGEVTIHSDDWQKGEYVRVEYDVDTATTTIKGQSSEIVISKAQ